MGYLYIKDEKIISHRTILKIILNPLLRRFFGFAIGSEIDDKKKKFLRYKIIRQKEPKTWSFKPNFEYDYKLKDK